MTKQDFIDWYVDTIRYLNEQPHGAFAVLMIAIPLLERYLREKSGLHEATSVNQAFYDEFASIFPCIKDDMVGKFWHRYRHGLLHQATFGQKPCGGIVPKSYIAAAANEWPEIINYDVPSETFVLLPKEFSERIIDIIDNDFITFMGLHSPNQSLPERTTPPVFNRASKTGAIKVVSAPAGTGNAP